MEMNEIATELENSHVHDVYSRTAHLFQDNNLGQYNIYYYSKFNFKLILVYLIYPIFYNNI